MKKLIYSFAAICLFFLAYPVSTGLAAQRAICPEGEHRFVVTLVHKANEREPGERLYTCEICGYSYSEEISPSGHEWSEWIVDKVPTEREAGHRYRYCKKYSHATHYQEEEIPPLSGSDEGAETQSLPGQTLPSQEETRKESEEAPETRDPARSEEAAVQARAQGGADEIPALEESPPQERAPAPEVQKEGEGKGSVEGEEKKERASLFSGKPNGIDLVSGIALAGMLWWYGAVLAPMFAVLRWIERKKAVLREKKNLC